MAEQAVGRNISLYPTELAMLQQIAKDHGLGSISAAVRFVLHDWAKMKMAQTPTLAPHRVEVEGEPAQAR